MLVADLADDGARDFLEGVALAGQVAYVPLLAAPVDRSTHTLEVYAPGAAEPLRCLADPIGPPTADGFPLRLRIDQPESAVALAAPAAPAARRDRPPSLRARHETTHDLTEHHTADLEGAPHELERVEVVGRALANGKLEVESLIGSGGAGAVYKARHKNLRMPVAVKVLHDNYQADESFGRRFHAEALAASRLDHPNITRVLDFGQEPDGLLYLVMEFLDGVGLRSLVDHAGAFGTERIVKLGSQICAGLAHAHARSILHKDVKPENLVILAGADDDGVPMEIVKVCDFGIAQSVHGEEKPRRFQGTPEYMSPEQCVSSELDARTDVYSVGVVLYELVTGTVPFAHDKIEHTVWCQINEEPVRPSLRVPAGVKVDPRLDRIILRALAKDRDQRFATMRDLRAALRDLLEKPPMSLSGQYQRFKVPVAAAPSAMPKAAPESSEWLIRGGGYVPDATPPSSSEPRDSGKQDVSAFMRRLVQTEDPRAFAELVVPLEATIHQLAKALDVETLWRLASTLDVLATEAPETPGSRAAIAASLLRVLRDPGTLGPIAQRVLSMGDATGERLIIAAGAFGAHALYSARVRQTGSEVRQRFRLALEQIGPAALPVLTGGLERLVDRLGAPNAPSIAEDLLLVTARVARTPDESLGALVGRYARSDIPALVRAAVVALPALWRERARPLVLGLLDHGAEEVVAASLLATALLVTSDELTPRHIARAFDAAGRKSTRLAAIEALKRTRGEARAVASDLVIGRLRRFGPVTTPEDAEIVLALSSALVATASSERAAAEIGELAAAWPDELASRAKALLDA